VAVGDEGNTAPPKNMGPIIIFWVVFGLASTLGMQVNSQTINTYLSLFKMDSGFSNSTTLPRLPSP
jgi:hypothetical protein